MGYQKLGRIIEQVTTVATAAGTTTLTNTSSQNHRFTGTDIQNMKLPDATTCPNGTIFRAKNDSTGIVTAQYNDNTTLKSISPDTSKEFILFDNSTSNGVWGVFEGSGSGSGSGGINYISNPGSDFSTSGWVTYADAAGTAPVNGTGGAPTVTWSRSTTTPLRGTADFNFVKDAANRQGEGVSYDFTIDSADKAKVLNISFDYEIVSGTYADTDLTVYIYDVTNGVVIQPSGYSIASSVGVPNKHVANFQSASNSTSYRLIIHVASTSAVAYTLAFDGFVVGPTAVINGTPVTDWVSYTPTGNWSGNTVYAGQWRRVGDSMELLINVALTGAPGGTSEFRVVLPNASQIDTTKINGSLGSGDDNVGHAWLLDSSTSASRNSGYVFPISATEVAIIADESSVVNHTTPFTWAISDALHFFVRVPILGWSSNIQMSADTDSRNVLFKASQAVFNIASATEISVNPNVTEFDTTGSYNQSNGEFTLPSSDTYRVTGMLYNGGTLTASVGSIELYIDLDGTKKSYVVNSIGASTADGATISTLIKGNAGQKIRFRAYQGGPVAEDFIAEFTVEKASRTSLTALNSAIENVVVLKDVKSANTAGGTFTSGAWQTRDLNTIENSKPWISLSANQFTLGFGTYKIKGYAPAAAVDRHKLKIRNTTDSTDDLIGMSAQAPTGSSQTTAMVDGIITVSGTKVFELQHRAQTTRATDGFGIESNFSVSEVYAVIEIEKLL